MMFIVDFVLCMNFNLITNHHHEYLAWHAGNMRVNYAYLRVCLEPSSKTSYKLR